MKYIKCECCKRRIRKMANQKYCSCCSIYLQTLKKQLIYYKRKKVNYCERLYGTKSGKERIRFKENAK